MQLKTNLVSLFSTLNKTPSQLAIAQPTAYKTSGFVRSRLVGSPAAYKTGGFVSRRLYKPLPFAKQKEEVCNPSICLRTLAKLKFASKGVLAQQS